MNGKTYVVGHKKPDTDSICAAIAFAEYKNQIEEEEYVAARAGEINPETSFVLKKFGKKKPPLIEDASNKKMFLVDHNEFSQAVDGVTESKLVGILDHHRIAKPESKKPIYFHTEPIGSTSTLVAEKLMKKNEKIEKGLAGILLSAILSDTVVHRSPTNTKKDEKIAQKLSEQLNINVEEYGKEMLHKKSKLGEKSPRNIVLGDFKEYEMGKKFVGIGQVETVTPEQVLEKEEEIKEEMEKIIEERRYDLLILLITDLLEEDSEAFVVGEINEFEKAFNVKIKDKSTFLEGVLSRKKQVVPNLKKQFE